MTVSRSLPIYHRQCSVFIPLTYVASAQPTIFREDSLITVKVIALVVFTNHGCASEKDLALGWVVGREVTNFRHVEKLDFHGRERETHRTILHDFWLDNGPHAPSLCLPISCAPLSAQTQVVTMMDTP